MLRSLLISMGISIIGCKTRQPLLFFDTGYFITECIAHFKINVIIDHCVFNIRTVTVQNGKRIAVKRICIGRFVAHYGI